MGKRLATVVLLAALVALVVVPLAIDQPFGEQSARTLAAAFTMRRWSPIVSLVGVLTVVALAVVALVRHSAEGATAALARHSTEGATAALARHSTEGATAARRPRLTTIGFGAAVAMAIAVAWFARQNPFEWMFNPLPRPQFVAAQKAAFVEPNDLVLSVSIDGDAAAYPIRQMAYHHLVNDRIGRTPAVVTY